MPEITEAEFFDRLERAFDPHVERPLVDTQALCFGPTDEQVNRRYDAILDQLDDLDNLEPYTPIPIFTEADFEDVEKLPIQRPYTPRYDRLFLKRVALEEELANLDSGSAPYHEAMAELARVMGKIKTELERSTDDVFREREGIDEWRATTGKDEFNASRRDREEANQMTPKEVLAVETPEEKKERLRKRDSELKRNKRAILKAKALRQAGG